MLKIKMENKIMVRPLLLTDQCFLIPDKPQGLYGPPLQKKKDIHIMFCSKS